MPVEPDLERLRARDPSAWEDLVAAHHKPLTQLVCRSLGGWHEDVRDIVQDSFLKAYRGIGEFRGESSVRAWLFRIALNTCHDHHWSGWRQRVVLYDALPEMAGDDLAESVAERVGLRSALDALPEEERVCVEMRFLQGLSGKEIAKAVGRKESAVWWQIHSALKRMRAALGDGEPR